ncbi:MAG: RNA-binding protein [Anaerolineales bacterium]|nr:RNA-binding protein [Anaerolineales bacterium]
MRLYVGNLSYDTTEDELRDAFEAYGAVTSVAIITDRETGRSRGFGFVEMGSDEEGQAAIDGMNERMVGGRTLKVNEARPRQDRRDGPRDRDRRSSYQDRDRNRNRW